MHGPVDEVARSLFFPLDLCLRGFSLSLSLSLSLSFSCFTIHVHFLCRIISFHCHFLVCSSSLYNNFAVFDDSISNTPHFLCLRTPSLQLIPLSIIHHKAISYSLALVANSIYMTIVLCRSKSLHSLENKHNNHSNTFTMAISLPMPLRLLLLAAVTSKLSSATPSLLRRADICAANGLEACPKNLPSSLCCPANSSCQALAGDTTVLCCPNDRSCEKISPITCDLRLQDPKVQPKAPIKTTVFDVKLKTCGSGTCCPYGYTCSDDGGKPQCFLDKDQSKTPKEMEDGNKNPSPTTVASTIEPTSTSAEPASSATTSAASSNEGSGSNSHPKLVSIIGGIIGACLVLLIIVTIVLMYIRRRRRNQVINEKSAFARNKPSGTPYGNIISEPIVQANSYRTDFILKSPSASSSISQQPANPRYSPKTPAQQFIQPPPPPRARQSIPNPFNSPTPSSCSDAASNRSDLPPQNDQIEGPARTGRVVNGRLAPIRSMKGSDRRSRRTSTRHVREEPSNETINIFADPTGSQRRRQSSHTTFTDMMDDAELGDVHRGKRYVPGTTPRM